MCACVCADKFRRLHVEIERFVHFFFMLFFLYFQLAYSMKHMQIGLKEKNRFHFSLLRIVFFSSFPSIWPGSITGLRRQLSTISSTCCNPYRQSSISPFQNVYTILQTPLIFINHLVFQMEGGGQGGGKPGLSYLLLFFSIFSHPFTD